MTPVSRDTHAFDAFFFKHYISVKSIHNEYLNGLDFLFFMFWTADHSIIGKEVYPSKSISFKLFSINNTILMENCKNIYRLGEITTLAP